MAYNGNTTNWPASSASGSTSLSLLERVKAQDPEAWQRLVKLYGPSIYDWCRRAGLQSAAAADVAQDVFASVAKSIDGFKRSESGGSFRAWLWGITRHRLLDHFRRRQGTPEAQGGTAAQQQMLQVPDVSEPSASSSVPMVKDPLWGRVLDAVRADFEDRTWQAFWRVVVDKQRPADVAQELGMTVCAVYQAKGRVLRQMRRQLTDLEEMG
jgi:RNA polymerase sigma-70 factor (ECF subfamily)